MLPVELKRVLAAVDFSDWSEPVLQMATELANRYDAPLTVVYAEMFLPPAYFTEGDIPKISDALEEQRKSAQRHLEQTVQTHVKGRVPVETCLVENVPTQSILDAVESAEAGLIVMGTHGRGGLNRLLMGSVAERIVREAQVPVLTVRGIGDESAGCRLPIRKILCPVNFTDVAEEALRYAGDLARRFDAELVVMTSLEGDEGALDLAIEEQKQKLCAWVPESVEAHCSIEPAVRQGNAAEQIVKTAREEQCDLVVIGAQHRPLLEATILGTTSIRVMRHATCPVLTVVRH